MVVRGKRLYQRLGTYVVRGCSDQVLVDKDPLLPGEQGRGQGSLGRVEVKLDRRQAETDEDQDSWNEDLDEEGLPVSS